MNNFDINKPYKSQIKISFESKEHANIIMKCMEVDEELQPNRLSKYFSVEENFLIM